MKLDVLTYFRTLLQPSSKDSIKSFSMFLTTILGFILGIMLGISLLIDASDGVIATDLYGCAVYVLSIGALVTLSSIPKMTIDKEKIKQGLEIETETEEKE